MRTGFLGFLAASVVILSGCNNDVSGNDNSSSNDQGQTSTPSGQLRGITKQNQLVVAQFVYRRMYWNDLGGFGTTIDERDAYQLANLAMLHNDYTTMTPVTTMAEGDALTNLCPSGGGLVRTETEDGGFLFTYDDCRWTTNFGNNRRMDGTVSLEPYTTEYNQGWIVGMFFDYGSSTQYRGELTYEYNSDTDYRITNFEVTVDQGTREQRYSDVDLERTPSTASFSGSLFSSNASANDEDNGTLIVSTNNLNKLDSPTRGELIIEGANGDKLTVQFKASGVDIQFNDEPPQSYSDSAFDPRA